MVLFQFVDPDSPASIRIPLGWYFVGQVPVLADAVVYFSCKFYQAVSIALSFRHILVVLTLLNLCKNYCI